MSIKKFKDYSKSEEINERGRTELFGVNRKPSNVISRQDQDFYDFYTRKKFRGLSKYELNSEVFKLAQRKDELGVLAQFCLQIERESIAADDYIVSVVDELAVDNKISLDDDDDGDFEDPIKPLQKKESLSKIFSKIDSMEEELKELKKKNEDLLEKLESVKNEKNP